MARKIVFDSTDEAAFAEQRERYDWHLLQNSAIHRVDTEEQLERAEALLGNLGYATRRIDASRWSNDASIYDSFASSLNFPFKGGRNLDALRDYLRDVAEFRYGSDPESDGTAVTVGGIQVLVEADRELSKKLLDVCDETARYASILGHPMLFLFSCPIPMTYGGARRVLVDYPINTSPSNFTP